MCAPHSLVTPEAPVGRQKRSLRLNAPGLKAKSLLQNSTYSNTSCGVVMTTDNVISNKRLVLKHAAGLAWKRCKQEERVTEDSVPPSQSVLGTDGTAGNTSPKS